MNLSNDAPNGKTFQENGFYVSVGPDDVKLSFGYDFIRETLRCTLELMMDAQGTKVEYDKFEITQDNKTKKTEKKKDTTATKTPTNMAPVKQPILQRAIVEDIKTHEEVL